MDATGAYHRQMVREFKGDSDHIVTPLMRLQDADYTKIILVTLPEATPVSQAAALQDDLRRRQTPMTRCCERVWTVSASRWRGLQAKPATMSSWCPGRRSHLSGSQR
jgi:hypothetical protein